MRRVSAFLVLGLMALAPGFSSAAEEDRIVVEDPATSTVKFKVTSEGNVTGNSVTVQQGAGEESNSVKFAVKDTAGLEQTIITADGKIGIGVSPVSPFHLSTTETSQDAKGASFYLTTKSLSGYSNAGAYFDVTGNPDDNSSAEIYGLYGVSRTSYGSYRTFNTLIGVRFTAQHRGTGILNNAIGVNAYPYNGSTGTINNAYGVYSRPWMASGLINNWYGIFIDNKSIGTGTIGNLFGVYVKEETAKNFFAGNLGIGTTNPTQKLEVAGGIRINTTAEKPACEPSTRGTFWFTQGAADDVVEACAMVGGAYQWKPLW